VTVTKRNKRTGTERLKLSFQKKKSAKQIKTSIKRWRAIVLKYSK